MKNISPELIEKIQIYFLDEIDYEEIEMLIDRGVIRIHGDWLSTDEMLERCSYKSGNEVIRLDDTHIMIILSEENAKKYGYHTDYIDYYY